MKFITGNSVSCGANMKPSRHNISTRRLSRSAREFHIGDKTMEPTTASLSTTDIQWPCPLAPATQQRLLAIARPYDYKQLTGALPGMLYVATGCLVGFTSNETLDNSLGKIFGHGSWFGVQFIDNPDYAPSELYEALLPTELLLFPLRELESLLQEDRDIYKMLFYIAQRNNRITLQLGSNTLFSLTTRVTYLLLELANQHAIANQQQPVLHITQQSLSQIAGISRPRVNEVLKVLADAGEVALHRGTIQLLDLAALKTRLPDFSLMYHDPVPHIDALSSTC